MARRDPPTVSQKISFCPGMRCESLMVFSGNPHKSQCDKRGEDHATVTIVSHRSSDLHPVTAKRDAFGVSRPSSNGETVSGPVVSGLGESEDDWRNPCSRTFMVGCDPADHSIASADAGAHSHGYIVDILDASQNCRVLKGVCRRKTVSERGGYVGGSCYVCATGGFYCFTHCFVFHVCVCSLWLGYRHDAGRVSQSHGLDLW